MANLEGRADCLVVDPGLEPEKITQFLGEKDLEPAALLITHGHSDHIGGNHALKARWPDCPITRPVIHDFLTTRYARSPARSLFFPGTGNRG